MNQVGRGLTIAENQSVGAMLGQPQNFLQARMMWLALLVNF